MSATSTASAYVTERELAPFFPISRPTPVDAAWCNASQAAHSFFEGHATAASSAGRRGFCAAFRGAGLLVIVVAKCISIPRELNRSIAARADDQAKPEVVAPLLIEFFGEARSPALEPTAVR